MKVVCFGELMLRLAPEGYLRFVQKKQKMKTNIAEEKIAGSK